MYHFMIILKRSMSKKISIDFNHKPYLSFQWLCSAVNTAKYKRLTPGSLIQDRTGESDVSRQLHELRQNEGYEHSILDVHDHRERHKQMTAWTESAFRIFIEYIIFFSLINIAQIPFSITSHIAAYKNDMNVENPKVGRYTKKT
jgi:hypothetical protein